MKKVKVPAGLKKCKQCGEYKGFCLSKTNHELKFRVSCACHEQICEVCRKKPNKFPIRSIYYRKTDEKLISVNYISGMAHSKSCILSKSWLEKRKREMDEMKKKG